MRTELNPDGTISLITSDGRTIVISRAVALGLIKNLATLLQKEKPDDR